MSVNSPALLIVPPYDAVQPAGPDAPPLGAILLADLRLGLASVERTIEARTSSPWCPIAVMVPPHPPRSAESVLGALPPHLVPVGAGEGEAIDPARVRQATDARPAPGPRELARYAAARIGGPGVVPALEICFGVEDSYSERVRPVPQSTVNRLRASGPLACNDWRTLAQIVGWHSGRDSEPMPPGLEGWTQRFLGLSAAEAAQRTGWEWILESALRRWGYVRDPNAGSGEYSTAVRGG